jgi:hypothetical protein
MPTFTSSREATKDEMAREIDRCHKVISELEARAEAAEAELNSMRGTDLYFWRAECFNAQESLIKRRARIAELEAALAARARVPDREAVARAMHSKETADWQLWTELTVTQQATWLSRADAAIAAMQDTKP